MKDTVQILELTAGQAEQGIADLIELLEDSVEGGASVGFLPPLANDEAEQYWRTVFQAMREDSRVLVAAMEENEIVGAVQLAYETRRNGSHRAEVMKLMVHSKARMCGIGRNLMQRAELIAKSGGRTLLVLDTRCGDFSESLYRSLGYCTAGIIPRYARSASGVLHDTVVMYRELE